MISIRLKYLVLASCIFLSSWLIVAQMSGSVILLLPCLLSFLALAVWSAVQGMAMPVFLFFLPFAPLLKVEQNAISFFTIALLAAYLVYAVRGSRNVNIHHIIPGACIIALTIVVKMVYGFSFDNSYALFCATLLLIPFVAREMNDKYDFYLLTVFFTLGISIAAITARQLASYPNISQFIETHDLLGAIRFSGYFGDPNFYSAHVTAALSGVLVMLLREESKKRIVSLVLMMGILVYCGLLSVSKSFFLVATCLLVLWLLSFLLKKGKISSKIAIVFVVTVGVVFLLSSTIFTDAIGLFIARFSRDQNISDFTTGRTDIWLDYLRAFGEEPLLLLFGRGYSKVLIGGKATHNTVLQIIFQLGLVGGGFLLAWMICFVRNLLPAASIKQNSLMPIFILVLGTFGPWLAIDLLFFDEFFLLPVYACVAIGALASNETS